MNQVEKLISDEIRGLSVYSLDEILNFIRFIRQKEFKKIKKDVFNSDNLNSELILMDRKQLSHLEEEFQNYQELYPREQ